MGQPPKTTQTIQTNETLQTRSCKSCESAITNWIKLRLTFQPPLIPSQCLKPRPILRTNWVDTVNHGPSARPPMAHVMSLLFPKKNFTVRMQCFFLNLVPDLSWSILINLQAFCTASSIRICKRTASNTVGGTSGEMERLSKNCGD